MKNPPNQMKLNLTEKADEIFYEWARKAPSFSTQELYELARSHFIAGFLAGLDHKVKRQKKRKNPKHTSL